MSKSAPDAHIASLMESTFGACRFARWNSGSYHDSHHAMYVAEVLAAMATRRRHDPERRLFLTQVALLHDADPRPSDVPTPASVRRTLDWMEKRRKVLQWRLSWTDEAYFTARALIARTDFPFSNIPRDDETTMSGASPYEIYRHCMLELDPDSRDRTFEDAQLLRFADQCANYCRDFETASASVDALSLEMEQTDRPMNRWELNTPAFIKDLAGDSMWDTRLKRQLGLGGRVFGQAELMLFFLPPDLQKNLERNRRLFQRERELRLVTTG